MTTNPDNEPTRLRDSRTVKMFFWPAVWLTLALLLFATWRLYWKAQLRHEQELVRAAGYPADLEELDAWYKKPVGRNAADYWVKAHSSWVKDQALEDWMPCMTTQPDSAAGMYNTEEKLGLQYPDDLMGKVRDYCAKNEPSFDLMREAAKVDGCRWNLDLKKGLAASVPYLGEQKRMCNLVSERMRLAAKDKDWSTFEEFMDVEYKLADDIGGGPTLISSLVADSIEAKGLNTLMCDLPFLDGNAVHLEAIQKTLMTQRAKADQRMAFAYHGEEALMLADSVISASLDEPKVWVMFRGRENSKAEVILWKTLGGLDHDRRKIAMQEQKIAEVNLLPSDKRLAAIRTVETDWDASVHPWELLCHEMTMMETSNLTINHLLSLTSFDTAITAIAVERYRLDHAKLPATLSDLVPAYLPAVPGDAFNHGKPLHYKVESDRFSVYSIGKNEIDDGGRVEYSWSWSGSGSAPPHADDITFTLLLPNAPRGIVPKRKDLPGVGK